MSKQKNSSKCPYDSHACRVYSFCGTKKCLSKKNKDSIDPLIKHIHLHRDRFIYTKDSVIGK